MEDKYNKRTTSRSFESRFGGGWISSAQYLAETMCARNAKFNRTELPPKFWNDKPWKDYYLYQIKLANALLKVYSQQVIFQALRTYNGMKTISLKSPYLKKELETLEKKNSNQVIEKTETVEMKQKPTFIKSKSLKRKLEDLDGEEK
jgi:hypothetical protein